MQMMNQSEIILPKTKDGEYYLSYSQISTWKRNKRDYIRQHFFKEPFTSNEYIEFGSKVGEALENNCFTSFTQKETEVLSSVPRYDVFEKELRLQRNGFYIVGYSDSITHCYTKLLDYKTGEISKKKKEYESPDYTQLDIYAAAIWQQYAVLPTDVKVILIDRRGNPFKNEPLTVGDKWIAIEKKVDQERIEIVLADVDKVAKEISDYYKVFLKLNELRV